MRKVAGALGTMLFAVVVASCADDKGTLDGVMEGAGGPGAGASEDFSGGGLPDDDCAQHDKCPDDGAGGDGAGSDSRSGSGSDGGSGSGGDSGGGGDTCDHDDDGDCDGNDCDHDEDGDCDHDEGDGHELDDCNLTQGYWKNHPEDWPVLSLMLGANAYSKAELLAILGTEVGMNGLTALAHQLIAAKLNVALGATATGIADTIADADALIGSLVVGTDYLHPSATSELVDALDEFNRGRAAGSRCE